MNTKIFSVDAVIEGSSAFFFISRSSQVQLFVQQSHGTILLLNGQKMNL
jgi:hypothetical protein